MSDPLLRDATDQIAALESRRIGAQELLKAALARHEQTHARLNAVVAANLERALERAKAIDDLRSRGEKLGPLAGLPMTIKDTFDVEGMPATAGIEAYRHRRCTDAAAVAHAKRAGAVVWGKTNVPVQAGDWQSFNPIYGATNNPWDAERTAGGSSGGAAAAVAVGVTALEIGSDIGGSLRVPASFCGVYSHKPTWGMVSQAGHVPPAPGSHAERDLNVVGPIARSARDLRLLLSVIEDGPLAARAAPADLKGLRLGLWLDDPALALDGEVRAVVEAFAGELGGQGAEIVPLSGFIDTPALLAAFRLLLGSTLAADLPPSQIRLFEAIRGPSKLALKLGADGESAAALAIAYTARHAEWVAADEVRARTAHRLSDTFARVDAILAPATPVTAFPHDHRSFASRKLTFSTGEKLPYIAMLRWIALATACGLPATTIPAGLSATGLPVGAQIIGPRGADGRTLAIAQGIEERLGGFIPPSAPEIV